MKLLITGACGFVGSTLAMAIREGWPGIEVVGLDNLSRRGSEWNVEPITRVGVRFVHGDVRQASDLESLAAVDWVIDAAANPSVGAGIDGRSTPRQLMEHNLGGTVELLEFCRRHGAGLVLLSTSRVYGIEALQGIPLRRGVTRFELDGAALPAGVSARGVNEGFSAEPPLSLYGSTKRASELLACEYASVFGLRVYVNRCGVMAGEGQLGTAEQGIFSFWLHAWAEGRPLKYIGFGGAGLQVRDCLHPLDLAPLIVKQMRYEGTDRPVVANVSGGMDSARSLAELSAWCRDRLGPHSVTPSDEPRRFDVPWLVLDASRAREAWDWSPTLGTGDVLERIARHTKRHPDWLSRCGLPPMQSLRAA